MTGWLKLLPKKEGGVDGAAEGVAEAESEEGGKVVDEKFEGVAEGEVGEVREVGEVGGEVVYGFVESHAKEEVEREGGGTQVG